MRESRTFAERAKVLKTDEAKKRYFLVFEGSSTEKIYFEALENARNDLDIDPLIEFVPIIRSYSEEGWSNPKKILNRVIANLEEEQTKQLTYESLLNRIMDYLYDEKILTTSKVQAHAIWKILVEGCEKILQKSLSNIVEDIEGNCKGLIEYLNQESGVVSIVEDIADIIQSSGITYDEDLDEICLVVDRDKESFTVEQYNYVLNTCKERSFGLYISNPCFEFWLLLHFDEVFDLDKDKLLENPQVTARRRYTEQELRKLLPGYSKGMYDSEKLMARVKKAIENEAQYCEDTERLIERLGSNVGVLINNIR